MSTLHRYWLQVGLACVIAWSAAGCQESPSVTDQGSSDPSAGGSSVTQDFSPDLAIPQGEDDVVAPPRQMSMGAGGGRPAELTEEQSAAEQASETAVTERPAPTRTRPSAPEQPAVTARLGIGDPAPPLAISQWVKGEPFEGFEPGQVYVVEFWATWCGPCLAGMPHLSQLQNDYGDDVRFVGITREDVEVVENFLGRQQSEGKTWNDIISYRLAIDADSATNQAYMQAAGQNGIPCAFIVGRDGHIEWIGHPMTMDRVLASIHGNEWDRDQAIAEFRVEQRLREASGQMSLLLRQQQFDDALLILDELETELGDSARLTGIRMTILQRAGRTEEAAALQVRMVDQSWDDAQILNQIAWNIAIAGGQRDLELAQRAALRASELTHHEDASILDTVARVYYEQGNLEEALAWQRKAVEQNPGMAALNDALEMYEAELAARVAASEAGTSDETVTPASGTASPEGGVDVVPAAGETPAASESEAPADTETTSAEAPAGAEDDTP